MEELGFKSGDTVKIRSERLNEVNATDGTSLKNRPFYVSCITAERVMQVTEYQNAIGTEGHARYDCMFRFFIHTRTVLTERRRDKKK